MTCSISHCLYDILTDPWKLFMYLCMYVCWRGDLIQQCYGLNVVGLFVDNFLCIPTKDNQCVYFMREFIVSWMGPY